MSRNILIHKHALHHGWRLGRNPCSTAIIQASFYRQYTSSRPCSTAVIQACVPRRASAVTVDKPRSQQQRHTLELPAQNFLQCFSNDLFGSGAVSESIEAIVADAHTGADQSTIPAIQIVTSITNSPAKRAFVKFANTTHGAVQGVLHCWNSSVPLEQFRTAGAGSSALLRRCRQFSTAGLSLL